MSIKLNIYKSNFCLMEFPDFAPPKIFMKVSSTSNNKKDLFVSVTLFKVNLHLI